MVELEIILKDAMHEITLMFCKARLREMAAMRAAREEAMEEEERANRLANRTFFITMNIIFGIIVVVR